MVVVPSKSNIASLKCSQLISPRAMNMALMAEVRGHGLKVPDKTGSDKTVHCLVVVEK